MSIQLSELLDLSPKTPVSVPTVRYNLSKAKDVEAGHGCTEPLDSKMIVLVVYKSQVLWMASLTRGLSSTRQNEKMHQASTFFLRKPVIESLSMGSKYTYILPYAIGLAVLAWTLGYADTGFRQSSLTYVTAHDVPIGTSVRLPSTDIFGKHVDSRVESVLVIAGSCTSCSVNAIEPHQVSDSPYAQIIFVYSGTIDQISKIVHKTSSNVRIVADPKSTIMDSLGAMTSPRFYVIENGKLKNIWKQTSEIPKEWIGLP